MQKKIKKTVAVILALVCIIVNIVVTPSDEVQAASKEKCYSLVQGNTLTIKEIKSVPKESSVTNIKNVKMTKTKKGLLVKGLKEGLTTIKYSGKKYRVFVLSNKVPKKAYDKISTPKVKNGVYYVIRESHGDEFVTVCNTNKKDVTVKYTHSDYKDKKTLFESRKHYVAGLGYNETYTFSEYTCMPYAKRSIKVIDTTVKSCAKESIKVKVLSIDNTNTVFQITNTNDCQTSTIIFITKEDKQGNAYSWGQTDPIVINAGETITYTDKNYGNKPYKVNIIDTHTFGV